MKFDGYWPPEGIRNQPEPRAQKSWIFMILGSVGMSPFVWFVGIGQKSTKNRHQAAQRRPTTHHRGDEVSRMTLGTGSYLYYIIYIYIYIYIYVFAHMMRVLRNAKAQNTVRPAHRQQLTCVRCIREDPFEPFLHSVYLFDHSLAPPDGARWID